MNYMEAIYLITGRIDWNFETQEDEKEIKPALVLRKIEK